MRADYKNVINSILKKDFDKPTLSVIRRILLFPIIFAWICFLTFCCSILIGWVTLIVCAFIIIVGLVNRDYSDFDLVLWLFLMTIFGFFIATYKYMRFGQYPSTQF